MLTRGVTVIFIFISILLEIRKQERREIGEEGMGYVIFISFPAILLLLIIAIAFYLIGRRIVRREVSGPAQFHYGPPVAGGTAPVPAPPHRVLEKPIEV